MRESRKFNVDWEEHQEFLSLWNIKKLKSITLEEYVDYGNPNTFVQHVEMGTIDLGSIRGAASYKFGIYKRAPEKEGSERFVYSEGQYSWLKHYGNNLTPNKVFDQVRENLLELVICAERRDFEGVDKVQGFYPGYKWKVAFLYSRGEMIPVFSEKPLRHFVSKLGYELKRRREYSNWYRFLYQNRPRDKSVYNYMRELFNNYDADNDSQSSQSKIQKEKTRKTPKTRKPSNDLNTSGGTRKASKATTYTSYHAELQQELRKYLSRKYSEIEELDFERDFIDVLLRTKKEVHYYEVKTGSPDVCIKKGLGQVLTYAQRDQRNTQYSNRHKKVIIFGKNKAQDEDLILVEFVKEKLNIDFEYLSLEEIS